MREHKHSNHVIVCVAVTGGAAPKSRSPFHPTTPDELVKESIACWQAGASMVHLHGRLLNGETTTSFSVYAELRQQLQNSGCDAILSFSAGDDGGKASHTERFSVAQAKADFSSLSAGSFNIGNRQYNNPPEYVREMAKRLSESGVSPEIEIFDTGQFDGIHRLIRERLLKPPHFFQLVFGVPGGMPIDARLLPILIDQLPRDSLWMASCHTDDSLLHDDFLTEVIRYGGHVRTGIEDIIFSAPGELAVSNLSLLSKCHELIHKSGKIPANVQQARLILGR